MPSGLSIPKLPLGGGIERDRKQEEGRLHGTDLHLEVGVTLDDLIRLLREQEFCCAGCQTPIPEPEFSLEIDNSKVFPQGPALVKVDEGGDHGTIDRRGRWFCLACSVNHPNGIAVRKIVLKNEWGYLLAWDSTANRPNWRELGIEMHRAVADGAVSALTRILVSGYKATDIWNLHEADRNLLVRNPRLRGFPVQRPSSLRDRVLWSGTMLADGIDHVTMKRLMDEGKTFVLLTSASLGMKVPASFGQEQVLIQSAILDPGASERVTGSVGGDNAVPQVANEEVVIVPAASMKEEERTKAATVVYGLDPFNPVAVSVPDRDSNTLREMALVVEPEPVARFATASSAAMEASSASMGFGKRPVFAATQEVLGLAGPPPDVEFEEPSMDDEPPE